jgi:hypothetical protein
VRRPDTGAAQGRGDHAPNAMDNPCDGRPPYQSRVRDRIRELTGRRGCAAGRWFLARLTMPTLDGTRRSPASHGRGEQLVLAVVFYDYGAVAEYWFARR